MAIEGDEHGGNFLKKRITTTMIITTTVIMILSGNAQSAWPGLVTFPQKALHSI